MENLARYLLFQLPGWALAALLLSGLWYAAVLSSYTAAGLLLLWIAKDFLLYQLVRTAYIPGGKGGAERFIGTRALARSGLDPRGYVKIGGELWRAELAQGEPPVLPGHQVTVRAVTGLTLLVTGQQAENGSSRPNASV